MKELDMVEKIREAIRTEIDKRFDAKHYRLIDKDDLAEIRLMIQGGEIELSVMEWDEDTCSIEYFLYWSKDDNESILTEIYKLCLILKELYVITGNLVKIDFYESLDKGNVTIALRHYADQFEVQSIMYILEAYNKVDLRKKNIDKSFIEKNYLILFELFDRKSNEIRKYFKQIIESEMYHRISKYGFRYRAVISEIFSAEDFVYSIYNQKIYVGFTQEGIERYIERYQLKLKGMSDYYEGIKYNIMLEKNDIYIWDKDLWLEAFNWLSILELKYGDVPIYLGYDKGRIIIRVIEFWICIIMETDNLEQKILEEKTKLNDLQVAFHKNTKENFLIMDYDLYKLSPEEFENMCYDLLCEEGYENIHRRGNVNTSDGGVDIEADELVRGIRTLEKRKWIFQCKRTKKLDKKELYDVEILLKEFQADRYGLFYAGVISPGVWDRRRAFSKDSVWLFDQDWIKQKLKEYRNVAEKYFPIYTMK